jgi:hypothetical protein
MKNLRRSNSDTARPFASMLTSISFALVTASAFVCCCCQVDNLPLIDVCGRSLAIMSGEGSCNSQRLLLWLLSL